MKKILYANGDSFVFGMECIPDKIKSEENKQLAFPKYFADLLGCKQYINNAYNGATNDFIFRKTIIDLQELEKSGASPSDVFVIIGITSLQRSEIDGDNWLGGQKYFDELFLTPDARNFVAYPAEYLIGKTMFVQPGLELDVLIHGREHSLSKHIKPFLTQFLWWESVQLESQEARIIALHDYLTLKGYDHVFVNTVCPLERSTNIDFSCKNFYKLNTDSFWKFAYTNYIKEERPCRHFSTVPHKAYASVIYDYVKNKIL